VRPGLLRRGHVRRHFGPRYGASARRVPILPPADALAKT
jgi:hypothetical protein